MTIIKTSITVKYTKKEVYSLSLSVYREKEIVFETHPDSGFPKYSLGDGIRGGIHSKKEMEFL